jgi:predicted nucleotidyltransferase
LKADFGASEVYLFGSLAEGGSFGDRSDIDLGARGLGAAHYRALGRLLSLSPDFEFDLVDLDACAEGLRDAVVTRGVVL